MKFPAVPLRTLLTLSMAAVSALALVPSAFADAKLIVTEIHYHPNETTDPNGLQKFVEIKNVGDEPQSMVGYTFGGIGNVTFTNQNVIQPGGFLVIARGNGSGFFNKYRFQPGAVFDGNLSQKGENVQIIDPAMNVVFAVKYWDGDNASAAGEEDRPLWPSNPDRGDADYTLVPLRPNVNPDPDDFRNWRPSINPNGGSPGADEPLPGGLFEVFINEVFTRDIDMVSNDAIEIFNPNATPVNIGNWWLSDNLDSPKKTQLPANTIVPAGGYLVFQNGVDGFSFGLSSQGERVFLYSADAGGNLTGYVNGLFFEASAEDRSFSRYVNSVGAEQFPAAPKSLGFPNAAPSVGPVVITEIMYDPGVDPDGAGAQKPPGGQFEFLEIKNTSAAVVPLYDPARPTRPNPANPAVQIPNNWRVGGVGGFILNGSQPSLQPGEVALIVSGTAGDAQYQAKFRADHPGVPAGMKIFGPFTGSLSDGGEEISLQRPDQALDDVFVNVDVVLYDNAAPWPGEAAGQGRSLVRSDPTIYGNDPASWEPSLLPGGSPGVIYNYSGPRILVNEVLAHTDIEPVPDGGQVDVIELHNPTAGDVNIGGWYLSDSKDNPTKFQIPAGTVIPAGGFWAVNQDNDANESNFLPAEYFGNAFQILSRGDQVYVFSADGSGQLTGYRHGFSFRATVNGRPANGGLTLGRHVDTFGREHFTKQVRSFEVNRFVPNPSAWANNPPSVGPVVISEINFDPSGTGSEFIELKNITDRSLNLYDDTGAGGNSNNTWSFHGVNFNFPTPRPTMAANATVIILPFGADAEVAAFRAANGVPAEVTIYGGSRGYTGALNNAGEELVLLRPDRPDVVDGQIIVPQIPVDLINYRDSEFWPAAGGGITLEKFNLVGFSDDPINWRASTTTNGTPGTTPQGISYDLWRLQNFAPGELGQAGLTGCDDDINGDGMPNLFAYAFGYDPHTFPDPDQLPQGVVIDESGAEFFAISFRRRVGATDLVYAPEYARDLTTWTGVGIQVGAAQDNGDGTETVRFNTGLTTNSTPRLFLRVRVSKG